MGKPLKSLGPACLCLPQHWGFKSEPQFSAFTEVLGSKPRSLRALLTTPPPANLPFMFLLGTDYILKQQNQISFSPYNFQTF